ncbi:dienelactone hydrolase family protein [Sphingobacterium paucimobilis]|nr:alpha/beta fold hydrolase [Sphingobacterium paucimobilis]
MLCHKTHRLLFLLLVFAFGQHVQAMIPQLQDTIPQVGRDELKSTIERIYMQKGPKKNITSRPELQIISKTKEADHERWHVKYLVDTEDYAFAYLLVPNTLKKGHKLPLILCPHPTAETGKDRVVGIYSAPAKDEQEQIGRDNRQYALDLVKRGFIAFAPDRAAYGQRRRPNGTANNKAEMVLEEQKLQLKYPGWGLTGKSIYDLQKALDMLTALDFVDSTQIGIVGHSLGAWDAILLAALDERIKATVVNAGGMVNYRPDLWKNPTALRRYLADTTRVNSLNTNANIFLMLAAPRAVLYQYSLFDSRNRGNSQLLECFRDVTNYYTILNQSKSADFNYFLHGYGHDFPLESRQLAYAWFEKRLFQNNKQKQ